MSARDDGGPAFPVVADAIMQNEAWGGMTLRDHFAAKAIPTATKWEEESPTHDGPSFQGIAERAYLLADAMLAARSE